MRIGNKVTMLKEQSRNVGVGKSNGFKMHSAVPSECVIFVDVTNIGAGGTLDISLQESWVDADTKYVASGVSLIGVGAGIHFLEPTSGNHGKGLYYRLSYEVKGNAVVFGTVMAKREEG